MKIVSWNVNGIRATLGKGLAEQIDALGADVLCLQEIKAMRDQVNDDWIDSWQHQLWNSAVRPGYSGVLILSKHKPLATFVGIGVAKHDSEGRVAVMEFDQFYLVNCYTPNAQNELARLPYRQEWNAAFLAFLRQLDSQKPVVLCGDLNVAHQEIDLARPKTNHFSAGFSDEERIDFSAMLDAGFTDTFRHANPQLGETYTWWSYRGGARAKNVGWRIDYFCVSTRFLPHTHSPSIHPMVMGSDHCPVSLVVG